MLGIYWPDKISNDELYERCQKRPVSDTIKYQRWKLYGHIRRRDESNPAQTAMEE